MQSRDIVLTGAITVAALLLITASALGGLRSPEGTAALGASLAEDAEVREVVADALVEALLDDAAERSPAAGGLLQLIRPLLAEAAAAAVESPAGRAALTSALTDALRQLTFSGPIVVDLRAAALIASDTAPAPLDTLARTAVEQGAVGVIVIGGEDIDPDLVPQAVPSEDQLGRVAGLPAGLTVALSGVVLLVLVIAQVGRDVAARPRRLLLAGAPPLLIGAATVVLLRIAPAQVVDRLIGSLAAAEPGSALVRLLELLADGLVDLLASTGLLAVALAALGLVLVLSAAGTRAAAGRRPRP